MKAGFGCKLFGAHQALMGIQDGVVLFHSVVGCNFGTMSFHFTACDMSDVRQTCTVISDSDVVFSGERSLMKALHHVRELYSPQVIFIVTGCVSDIIQDDVRSVTEEFHRATGQEVITLEAAGYRGSLNDGYEEALAALAGYMEPTERAEIPTVNLIGLGADDYRLRFDIPAIRTLLGDQVAVQTVFGRCRFEDVRKSAAAGLNLVLGRGVALAERMKERFGIPYEMIDYPYGLTGARKLWNALAAHLPVDHTVAETAFRQRTGREAQYSYSYIQGLYNLPVAVVGTGARARGLADFLSAELGMVVEVCAVREEYREMERFYDKVKASEAAILFGSSFEQDLADELEIPLVRFDYPVFDRVVLSPRPYVGEQGTLCLIEDILNEVIHARKVKGALYR